MELYNPLKKEQPKQEPIYNPLRQAAQPKPYFYTSSLSGQDRTAHLLSGVTGHSFDDVQKSLRDGTIQSVQSEALAVANTATAVRNSAAVEAAYFDGADPAKAAETIAEAFAQVPMFAGMVDPAIVSSVFSSDNELAKASLGKQFNNMELLYQIASSKVEEATAPWYSDFDGLQNFISTATPGYSLLSAKKKEEGINKFRALVFSDLTQEEFTKQANALFDEMGDIGDWFGEKNRVSLGSFLDGVPEGGAAGTAIDKAFGVLDIALLPSAGLVEGATALGKATVKGVTSASVDTLRLGGIVFRDPKLVRKIMDTTAIIDDPARSSSILSNHLNTSLATPNVTRPRPLTAASSTAVKDWQDASEVTAIVRRLRGPEMLSEVAVEQLKGDIIAAKTATGHRQVVDRDVFLDDFENIIYSETLGTASGKEFATALSAERFARSVDGIVTKTDAGGFVVRKEENIGLIDPLRTGKGSNTIEGLVLFKTTAVEELGEGFWARWGSPMAQTTDLNQALLVQKEATQAVYVRAVESRFKALTKTMKKSEMRNVERMFEDLQNGTASARPAAYSEAEFKQEFYQKYNRQPRDEETAYYLMSQELNDLDWALKADIKFKDEVVKNTVVLRNTGEDLNVRPIQASSVPDKDMILDADTGLLVSKSSLTANDKVFSVATEFAYRTKSGEFVQFVKTSAPRTRRIGPEDVLPRNPGGPRRYAPNGIQRYLKQEREVVFAGGRKAAEKPLTIMGVRTEAEAITAERQFNAIADAVNKAIGKKLLVSEAPAEVNKWLRQNAGNPAILAAIKSNADFNLNISSIDDLVDFAEQTGVNLRKRVEQVGDNMPLVSSRDDYIPGVDKALSFGDSFRSAGMTRGARKDKPLIGFGGAPNKTIAATDSIRRSALSSLARKTEASYAAAATNGLIRAILENKANIRSLQELNGLTLRGKLTRLSDLIDTTTLAGKKLMLERDKIEWRLKQRSSYGAAWDNAKLSLANKLYGKGWKATAEKMDMWSTDPVSFARGWTFDIHLGLFAWDQFYVQASQLANVVGIADTASAIKASSYYTINRGLLMNGNENVLRWTAERVAPIIDMTPDQYVEMITMLKESGTTLIDVSIAELGDDFGGSMIGNIRNKGRVFFKEGELISVISAHHTAYLELIKKHPKIKPNSQEGRRWIAKRQNTLRQGMTSVNKSVGQDLPFAQFLTYSWRVAEAMFSGTLGGGSRKVLTGKEKSKLALTHMSVFGLAAVPGGGYVFDRVDEKYGVQVDGGMYDFLRGGMYDFLLSMATGEPTAASSRLAWGEGVTDTIVNLMDANIIEALVGPSGQFASGSMSSTLNFLKDLSSGVGTGDYSVVKMDLSAMARGVHSWALTEKLYFGILYGRYYANSGTSLYDWEVSPTESILLAMGVPLRKYEEMSLIGNMRFQDANYEKKVGERLKELVVQIDKLALDDDVEGQKAIYREVLTILNMHTGQQGQRITSAFKAYAYPKIDTVLMQAIERDMKPRFLSEEQ